MRGGNGGTIAPRSCCLGSLGGGTCLGSLGGGACLGSLGVVAGSDVLEMGVVVGGGAVGSPPVLIGRMASATAAAAAAATAAFDLAVALAVGTCPLVCLSGRG